VCGCGKSAAAQHHVITRQELKKWSKGKQRCIAKRSWGSLCRDKRNLVPVAFDCHGAHHSKARPLFLQDLPNGVFQFAAEVMGPGPAVAYLSRYYEGAESEPRLAPLVERAAAA
jgi:hypothetical protein